jgi:ferritin-like metal-binding protein YciE
MIGKMNNLRELFEIELKYAYDCEQKLVKKGIPTMIENAGSPELRTALEHHLRETQSHIARLEQVFAAIGKEPDSKGNEILDKILSAAKDSVSNIDDSPLRDSALIANGNLVEHYEIATYGTLAALARHLGLQKAADAKLTQIGETVLNPRVAKSHTA